MVSGNRWLLLDYLQTWLDSTCEITFTTDIPVHVFMRYTTISPRMHLLYMEKRGLAMMKDPYFCFVAWQEIEQDEPGDTLTHTITWPGWYHCLTQWFYFRGEIAGQPTPTQWGILKKHYTAPMVHTLLVAFNGDAVNIWYPVNKAVHYLKCRLQDTVYTPPEPLHMYGWFAGNFVHMRVYDGPTWAGDIFTFDDLPGEITDITKVEVINIVGKLYVYGWGKTRLKTHGTLYEGAQYAIGGPGLVTYSTVYLVNPFTSLPWTPAEVNALQAGLALAHAGTFGRAICDQVKVEVSYRPVV